MMSEDLRARQAPVKARYRDDPASARATLHAEGRLDGPDLTCRVITPRGVAESGLHPMAGGDGLSLCSGDMLLESLVACAGVTLRAVALAIGVDIRGGTIRAEGDLDFRGTLGVGKDVPVGFAAIRVRFDLEADASADQLANLLRLTERYCVILQTLRSAPVITSTIEGTHGTN